MTFPQEIFTELISYLKMLQRKGIKSVYTEPVSRLPIERGEEMEMCPKQETVVRAQEELALLEMSVKECVDCPLHQSRSKAVFGVGNPRTKVVFIGEAPGRDEDLKGEPFVGRAGQLLTRIFDAIELKREEVFITNILKCRPPENRDPAESEVRCCEKYLVQQIEVIRPDIICALGRISAQWLLRTKAPLSSLRLGEHIYQGIPVLVTYHPAALLRQPQLKKGAWEDFKKLKQTLDALQ